MYNNNNRIESGWFALIIALYAGPPAEEQPPSSPQKRLRGDNDINSPEPTPVTGSLSRLRR